MTLAKVKTIGDVTYEVIPLNASDSIEVAARVLGVVGTGLRSVAALRDAAAAIGALLAGSVEALQAEDLKFLAATFAKVSKAVDGDKKVPLANAFDEHFRGRFWDMLDWVRFAAEVTYGPLGDIPSRMTPTEGSSPPAAG